MIRKIPARSALCAAVVSALAIAPSVFSQTADTSQPTPKNTSEAIADDETIVMSPFFVETTEDVGYQAKSTIAGTRIRTDLKDVGSSISVVTASFLKDTNSKNAEQLLIYTTNTEVAGQGGNFLGQGDGPFVTGSALNKPVTNTRVRGLAEADNTRDFYLSDIPWDSYNVGRVDLQRGPNSILFGIGSPAGIVNSSLNGAAFRDLLKVENQIGSFGSVRFTGNFNKVLIKDELALRVDLLSDKTKYRQDPAYRDDKRIFGGARWDPSFLRQESARTSIRVNFESGKVESNMPRYTPPIDTITPWFASMGKATFDGRTLNNGEVTTPSGNVSNPYIGPIANRVYDGVTTTFDGPTQGFSYPTKVQGSPPSSAGVGNNGIKGIATTDLYAKQAHLVGSGSGLWKAKSLTDENVFDFYNYLIEGPNKSEFNKFKAFNAAISQTFLNDKLGFEVAVDSQNARWGNDTTMAEDGTTVTIDINNTLLDGSPNPNVGRPMVVLGGGSAGVYREERDRDTIRATAFGELNFTDLCGKESIAAKIFGRNTFTALWSKQTDEDQNQKGPRWYLPSAFAPNASAGGIGQGSRDVIVTAYVGPSMASATSASSLNFHGLKTKISPKDSSIYVWDAGSSSFRSIGLPIYDSDNYDDSAKTYTTGFKSKNVVKSSAVVWQGYWLDGALVPLVGLRRDGLVHQGAATPALTGENGAVNINDPKWILPNAADATKGLTYQDISGTSKTYSLVTHLPKSIRSKLPGNTDISLFANKSENFKPESRRDIKGQTLDASKGDTKEYGFSITTLNDRLIFKAVHYETTVKNATLNGALAGFYLIGAVEWWGGNAARAQRDATGASGDGWQAGTYYTAGPGGTSVVAISSSGQRMTVQPDITPGNTTYNAHLAQVLTTAGVPLTTGTDANGTLLYSQLAIDTSVADYSASINDWFAKLAPANLQSAWEFVSTSAAGPQNKDGNYNPTGMAVTGTTKSKGWEFEVMATPVDGLEISFNASKTAAQRSDLAAGYTSWILQRWRDLQGPMGDIRIWGGSTNGETTRSKFRNETYAGYLFYNALQGSDAPELNKWRYNVVSNYTFKKNALKGANIGASYRWQDAKTIGFKSKVGLDPVTGTNIDVADLAQPVMGKSENYLDLWVGYQRKVYKNIEWRIQFNVRNVFAKDELIPNTIQPNGEVATYRIPEPRTYTLTNTFTF
ncbi:MAG: TonB-dependent receptor [Verrucomicrobia bacterium]|nr:TonB-dependent receptor [Verrucomicrobiota bacterium]